MPQTFPPFPVRHPPGPPLSLSRRAAPVAPPANPPAGDFDRLLHEREQALVERERLAAEAEACIAERTRDLDEMEALLRAREALIASARLRDTGRGGPVTPREAEALRQLKAELDRQEAALLAAREALHAREKFVEESEARLFEKVQAQQEKETELEQREEQLRPPAACRAVPLDEFRE